MQKKKIIISVSNDLTTDQRVDRICNSLVSYGFDVLLVGRKLANSTKKLNRTYSYKRLRLLFNKGVLFYACLNINLLILLLFKKADYLLANDLDTLPANFLAAKIKRKKLYYDSHELFTEVPELNNRKFVKKIWLIIERMCLPRVNKAYTVCNSIAKYYKDKYNVNFNVIRNLPYYIDTKLEFESKNNTIIYQGALNKDRGLELLIKSMKWVDNHKLIIAGDGDISDELKSLVAKLNLDNKISFLGKLQYDKLKIQTSKAVLGVSLERNTNLNYYYALPNKIFDYINSAVPVLCSNLPEMSAIVNEYNVGTVFNGDNEKQLADLLNEILADKNKLKAWHKNCITVSIGLCWEKEQEKLKQIFQDTNPINN